MKRAFILIILLTFNSFLFAQDFALKLKLQSNEKTKSNLINNHEKMNSINQRYKSSGLEACYPNAKTPELLLYYNFRGNGKKNEAIQELNNLGTFEPEIVDEERVYPNSSCENPLPPVNDTWIIQHWANNYALELIEANCAWDISKGSSNIFIGIADSDFEITHDDLKNQITSIGGPISAHNSHGTWVAGVASAETNNNTGVAGIGYNSKIAAYRIYHESDGSAFAPNIRSSIWSLYQAGRPIINVSWTSTGLDALAAQEITQNGTVLVLAAGNIPNATNHSTIANIPGVINVSSVDMNNQHGPTGHAHNQWVDICAPGVNVTTTFTNNTYGGGWGTSIAAPLVSGTIALMLEVNPCLTPSEIEQLIKQSTDPIADAASFNGLLGAGRLNAYKAVKAAGTRTYTNTILSGTQNLFAGFGFNLTGVSIGSSSNINLNARKEVIINTFEVPLGSTFSINMISNVQTNCQ